MSSYSGRDGYRAAEDPGRWASNETDRIYGLSCLYTPQINGICRADLAVRSVRSVASLQASFERHGHRIAWSYDNGFASSNYLPREVERDLRLELNRIDPVRYPLRSGRSRADTFR